MNVLIFMIPAALVLAGVALAAFLWSLKAGQFEDPAGAAVRALNDEERPGG
jgi:cbb3-type cytochrome oxidase maturation protein